MKSASIATILSVVALGGLAVVYIELDSQGDKLERLLQARSESRRTVDLAPEAADEGGWVNRPAERGMVPVSDGRADAEAEGRAAPMSRNELEDTVADLRRKVDKMERDKRSPMPMRMHGMPRYARDVKQLSSMLKLTKAQTARVEDAVERGKRRVEEIMSIPDATGTTPLQRRKELRKKIADAQKTGKYQQVVSAAMSAQNYRNTKIPGRNETYGQAIKAVQDDTRAEIAQNLNDSQKKDFEDTRIDPLVSGEGGTTMAFSYVATGEPGTDGAIVHEGAEIHVVGGDSASEAEADAKADDEKEDE